MEIRYAPSPWRVDAETSNHAPIITAADGKGRDIAEIRGDTKEERAATASLIAAAPDLLEMLRAALPLIDDAAQDARSKHGNGSRSHLALTRQAEVTRDAIAKAEGSQS